MLAVLSRFPEILRAKTGWGRLGVAFLFGALASLTFAPFSLVFVLWISFPALVFLLQGADTARRAFATGWFFAFGLMMFSLYWIAGSLFVDIGAFWWALPVAVAGLPAGFSLYYAVAASVAWRWGLQRWPGVLFLGFAWFLADTARGTFFTGFPWDLMGYAWSFSLPILQITSVIGIAGLSLLTLLLAPLPAVLAPSLRTRGAVGVLIAFCGLFLGFAVWGQGRLDATPTHFVPDVRLRLIQEGVSQSLKWKHDLTEQHFRNILDLTKTPAEREPTIVVWPETAVAIYLTEEPLVRSAIAASLPKGAKLLTGTVRRAYDEKQGLRYYNSLIALDDRGNVIAGYDKTHLVPFGEFMPFRSILPVGAIAGMGSSDFTSGTGARTLRVEGLPPFSPLICYESIFSGDVVDPGDRPQAIVNVTNDAWYENTTGPDQHFAIARVRAIEEGLPLIRVANLGVVAVTDPLGRIVSIKDNLLPGFVDSDLPSALERPTLFFLHGKNFVFAGVLLLFLSLFVLRRLNRDDIAAHG